MTLVLKEEAANYKPVEAGTYMAVCVGIYDLGVHHNEKFDKYQAKVMLQWELIGETKDDGSPILIAKDFTASFNSKSNLRKDLESWRGKQFTAEELAGFDLSNILKLPCQLQIIHKEVGDRVYANISGIMGVPKGTVVPEVETKVVTFDLDKDTALDDLGALPGWIQNKVKQSKTYEQMTREPEPFDDVPEGDGELPF